MNQFDEKVEKAVWKVHQHIKEQVQDSEPTHVLAAFVRETVGNPTPYVVSIGTGTNWIAHECLATDGKTVLDSHAEVIARRGFKRYLYHELKTHNEAPDNSIFHTSDVTKDKLCLKDKYKIHLYISTVPCGCASPNASYNVKLMTRKERSEEFLLTDSEISKKHESWDYVSQKGSLNLRTMTCSDKVCQWNVVGVQGALLSHFLDPIYLNSIIIGSNFQKNRAHLALCGRLDHFRKMPYNLPKPFRVHKPRITGLKDSRKINNGNKTSLNWFCEGMVLHVEVNNGFLGRTVVEENPSRLCKQELFTAFSKVCELHLFGWDELLKNDPTYLELKETASSYKEAKTALRKYFKSSGLGYWIGKPQEVDMFRLK